MLPQTATDHSHKVPLNYSRDLCIEMGLNLKSMLSRIISIKAMSMRCILDNYAICYVNN